MSQWTPFEFSLAITLSACGVVTVLVVMLLLVQPIVTIGDWLDMKLKTWWRDRHNNP